MCVCMLRSQAPHEMGPFGEKGRNVVCEMPTSQSLGFQVDFLGFAASTFGGRVLLIQTYVLVNSDSTIRPIRDPQSKGLTYKKIYRRWPQNTLV